MSNSQMIDVKDSQVLLPPGPTLGCRVLIVDDDELVLESLSALVLLGGYEVFTARSGGEEFVVVLPDTNLNEASGIAERLREVISANPMATSGGVLSITVSIGICVLETKQEFSGASVLDLLRAADQGLYASKRLGRNRAATMTVGSAQVGANVPSGLIHDAA
jgi:predicted signal transduction protein with EAL and GGDEF domain